MARLPSSFNANDHEEMGSFDVLPKGKYIVKITDSDYVPNRKKTGHILKLTREIVSGEYKGRKIFRNLNLDNPNPAAVEIANKELTSTLKACGLVSIEDSVELHGIEHEIELYVKKGKGDEPDSNEISAINPIEGAARPSKPTSRSTAGASKNRRRPVFEDDDDDGDD